MTKYLLNQRFFTYLLGEKEVGKTPEKKDHENNVCINPSPLIENKMSNIS